MKKKDLFLISGIVWLILLGIFYTLKINVDDGSNYVVQDNLLGIIIFHNVWIFIIYLLMGFALILFGLRQK